MLARHPAGSRPRSVRLPDISRRGLAAGFVLAAGVMLATCKIDKLITPPSGGLLDVRPPTLTDSAELGSTAPHLLQIAIANAARGPLTWSAAVARGSAWISLGETGGTTPDTLTVALDPRGLATAAYRDTVVITASGSSAGELRVPVSFVVQPCPLVPISIGTPVSGALSTAACAAPHRAGRAARLYSFAASAGDSVTIEMSSSALNAYLLFDSATTALPLAENDNCPVGGSFAGDACLPYQRIPRSGTYVIEATSSAAASYGAFSLLLSPPRPPTPPDTLAQLLADSVTTLAVGGSTDQPAVVLRGVVSDPDRGDSLRLEVEVRPVGTAFSAGMFSGAPVANGQRATALVTGLQDNTAYHWRARAVDQTGRAGAWTAFGGNAESSPDFTVQAGHAPSPPSGLGQFKSNQTTPLGVGATTDEGTVVFKSTVNDPDAGDSLRLGVEVRPIDSAFTNTPSGSSVKVANGSVAVVAIGGFRDNTAYHWQARVTDLSGRTSGWTSFGNNSDAPPAAADFRVALPVTSLVFTVQPSAVVAGTAISPTVTVTALDADNQPATSFTGTVTLAIGTNPGGATLSGTTSVGAVAGVATFPGISLDKTGSGYTLQASLAGGSVTATSATFAVTPGPAASLAFTVQPGTAIAGQPIAPAVQVTARDAHGNTATGFTGNVTIAIKNNPAGGTLTGKTTVAAVSGVARFDSLVIDKAGTGYTLSDTATGLAGSVSNPFDVNPASATRLAFTVQPSTVAAGAAITPAVQVAARDAYNNTVTTFTGSVTISFGVNAGGGTLSGDTTVTAVAGVATFSNLHVDKAATGYTLTASSPGSAAAESAPFTVTAGTATQLAFTAQPSSAVAGAAITPAVQVTARDAQGNVATGFTGTVTIKIGTNPGGGTLSGTASVAATAGVATFGDLSIDKAAGGYTLTAAAQSVTGATSTPFDITPGAASELAFTVQPSNTTAGAAISPAVQVTARDAHGNVATSFSGTVTVSLGSNPGGDTLSGTTTATAAAGVASFGDLRVNKAAAGYTLAATANAVTGATSSTFTVAPGAASVLVFTGQPSATTAGATISPAVQVTARDALGNTATGFTGNVTVKIGNDPAGGSTLSGTLSVPASAGVATFSNLSIDKAGTGFTLTAAATAVTGATSDAFDVTPGTASKLVFSVQPSTVTAGAAIAPAVAVTAQDAQGNTVPTFTDSVTVAIGTNAGGGTLSGTIRVAAVAGVATFSTLSIDKAGAGYTLTATASGATGTISAPFTVNPGPAAQLAFTTQPASTTAGAILSPAVQVTARDAQGNVATSFTGDVTVAIGTNPGGSTLSGTTTIAAVAGVATFGNLSLNKTGSGYTLTAKSGALPTATSAAFNVSPAAATRLVFTVQPASATAGVALTPAVQVTMEDTLGNVITAFGGNVTVAIGNGPSGASLGGTTTVAAASGVATFSDLSITKAGTGYTLTAGASGSATGASAAFTITPAAASKLAFSVEPPGGVTAGATITPAVQVSALDAFDNTATSFTGTVAVAIGTNPGGSTLGGATSAPAASGVATFSTLSLNKTGSGYTLTAGATGLSGGTSTAFAVTPGAAATLQFTVQPTTVVAGQAIAPAPQVTAYDAQGNVASGFAGTVTVSIGANPGGSTLSGTTTIAASAGVATFSNLALNKVGSGYTLAAASAGLAGTVSGGFNVTPGAASQLVFTVEPSTTVAGATISPAVVVTALDVNGNTATGFTGNVTVALGNNPTGASMTGTRTVAAVAGVATYSTLSIDRAGSGYTLVSASPGLITGGSTAFDITAAPATQLVFTAQPATTVAGAALPTVAVTARDQFGNTATGYTGNVTVAITGGTGTAGAALRGTKTVAAVAGVASFPGLSVDSAGSGYTLSVTAAGLTGAQSASFNITPGLATHLVFTGQPSATVAGAVISPAVTVAAKDSVGNTDPTFVATVSVAIGANPSGGTLSGTASGSAVAGVATFSGLSIDKSGAGYTLTAAATGLIGATSAPFTVTAGPAAQLAFTVQPASTTAGATISPVQVTARDALGNTATSFGGNVTVAIGTNPGGATLSGTATQSAASGVATFSNLSIDKAGTGYTLAASSGLLTPGASAAFNITAGAATTIALVSGNAQTDTIGATLVNPYVVKVTDDNGNGVSGVTVTWAVQDNGSITPSSQTDAAGLATATRTLGTAVGTQTATATVAGLTGSPVTFTATVTHGAAASLAINAGNDQSAPVNTAVAVAPSVVARDRAANPVNGVGVTFAVASGGGTVDPTTPVATNLSGVAAVNSWTLGSSAGSNTLTASATGLTPVTFTATATAAAASQIAVNGGDGQSATVGTAVATTPSVIVRDQFNNPVAGVAVTFAIGSGGGAVNPTAPVSTDASGIAAVTSWTLGTAAGPNTLTATATGLAGSPVTFTATATPGPVSAATTTVAAAPDPITASSGATTTTIAVTARDQYNNAVSGATVVLAATGTGNTLTQPGPTNATGQATGALSSTKAEAKIISATVNGTPITQTDTVTVAAAAVSADSSLISANPTSITASSGGIVSTITVTSRDAFGNPRAGDAVTLAATGSGNTLTQPAAATNGLGQTTGTLSSTTAEAKTVSATVAGTPIMPTATVTVVAGSTAVKLNFLGTIATTVAGATITPAVQVAVADSFGNTLTTGSRPNVTVAILSNPGGGTLSGTTTVATAGGGSPRVASFSTLSINKAGTGYTLLATSGTIAADTSPPFDITAGAAKTIALNGGNAQTDTIGATLATPLSVKVTDVNGNAVSGVTVTWSGTGGAAPSTPTSLTDGTGVASVLLTLGTTAGAQGASAAAAGLTGSPVTFTATATHGNPAAIAIRAGDGQTATVNTAVATDPSVTVTDRAGNPVDQVPVTFAVASGGGTVVPTTPVNTNASGVATVTSWTLGTTAGANTLTATAAGTGITGNPVTFTATGTAGTATQLSFTTQPSTDTAGQAISPAVVVTALDAFGNTATSFTNAVTVAITAGTGTSGAHLNGTKKVTPVAGVATFSDLSVDSAGTGYTLTATDGGAVGTTTSAAFAVAPGTVAQLVWVQQPTTTAANTNISPSPSLRALDAVGNLVTWFTGTVTMTIVNDGAASPPAVLSGGSVSAAGGVATFTTLQIDRAGTGYTIRGSTGAVSSAASSPFDIL